MYVNRGKYKGTLIKGYENASTRATASRVYDSLFDYLSPYIKEASVLDLFAGTGQLGITALSMGAKEAVFNDLDKGAFQNIKDNLNAINVNALVMNFDYEKALSFLSLRNTKFDLIFLDPPYSKINIDNIISKLINLNLLNDKAIIIVETDENLNLNYHLLNHKNYGYKQIYIYEI